MNLQCVQKKTDIKKRQRKEKLKEKGAQSKSRIDRQKKRTDLKQTQRKVISLKSCILGASCGSGNLLLEYYESFYNTKNEVFR